MRPAHSFVAVATSFLLVSVASASPAMISREDISDSVAKKSFTSFTEDWMGRAVARGARDSKEPRAHTGRKGLVFTYRAVDQEFDTELRPTGRAISPFVGVLHYTEHTYTCKDIQGGDCTVTSSLPVTEVFRYREGSWSY